MFNCNFKHTVKRLSRVLVLLGFGLPALILANGPALGSDAAPLGPPTDRADLGPELELLEDPEGRLTYGQATVQPWKDRFRPNRRAKLSLGFSTSAWWVRFRIAESNRPRVLRVAKANLDEVDIYIPTARGLEKYITGDRRPAGGRPIRSRTFVFPIPSDYLAGEFIHLRLKSHTSLNLKVQLRSFSNWSSRASQELVIFSLLLGSILVLVIYNFFIYVTLRDSTYLYYVIFMLGVAIFSFRLYGLSSVLVDLPHRLVVPLTWLTLGVGQLGGILFSRRFLNTKVNAPLVDKLILIAGAAAVLVIILGLTEQYYAANLLNHYGGGLTCLIFISAGIVCYRRGFHAARYYLWAWTLFMISLLFFVMGGVLIPSTFFTFHAVLVGTVFQAIFLSFALADRIRGLRRERAQLREQKQRLTELSIRDELTGLYNKRCYSSRLSSEMEHARRLDLDLSLVMIDVDHFKDFNDTHGHAAGDVVLAELGQVVLRTTRETDIPCRYGGEEFAVILPGSDLEGAGAIAERLRSRFERLRFPTPEHGRVGSTISLGVTQLIDDDDEKTLFDRADQALYQAKEQGRNKVISL